MEMTVPDRRHHPQVIRAKELAREAGLNPYARIETPGDSWRSKRVYSDFMDAAFEEHFRRVAVDNIYWDQGGSFYTERWDVPRYDNCRFSYGRCKSGSRWFWLVHGYGEVRECGEHGWADTEEQALIAGTAAIKRFAGDRRAIVDCRHGYASHQLKQINAAKRVKRWSDAPADGSGTRATEYLYDRWGDEFRITKKTTKRIFYVKEIYCDEPQVGFVPRYRVADDWPGPSWRELRDLEDKVGWRNVPRFFLKPRPPGFDREPLPKIDLHKLKAEMAAAHPDKGGSNEAIREARARYVEARRQLRTGASTS
jgi:hypothetical protein